MIAVDYLIAGQGIAGTLLSYELVQAGKSVLVLDPHESMTTASRVAGAVINPLSGKHWRPVANADHILPKALATYQAMSHLLATDLLQESRLYLFAHHIENTPAFTELPDVHDAFLADYFHHAGLIKLVQPVWLVHAARLLDQWRGYLKVSGAFRMEQLDYSQIEIGRRQITYRNIEARQLVFCEGAAVAGNPWFAHLPFTANRGEALILDIPGLPVDALYHNRFRLVPRHDGLFWCGSNYRWQFADKEPDLEWRNEVLQFLKQWLRLPVTLVDHQVALRPTTAGQQVIMGHAARSNQISIFNGLGTRGYSSGPYYAAIMAEDLISSSLPVV